MIARCAIGRADPAILEKRLGKSNVGARLTGAIVARGQPPSGANASPPYLDVRVRRHALLLGRRLHFLDLHRSRQPGGCRSKCRANDPARRKRRVEETRSIISRRRTAEAPVSAPRHSETRICDSTSFPARLGCFFISFHRRCRERASLLAGTSNGTAERFSSFARTSDKRKGSSSDLPSSRSRKRTRTAYDRPDARRVRRSGGCLRRRCRLPSPGFAPARARCRQARCDLSHL